MAKEKYVQLKCEELDFLRQLIKIEPRRALEKYLKYYRRGVKPTQICQDLLIKQEWLPKYFIKFSSTIEMIDYGKVKLIRLRKYWKCLKLSEAITTGKLMPFS